LTLGDYSEPQLRIELSADERFEPAMTSLEKEGLIAQSNNLIHLKR